MTIVGTTDGVERICLQRREHSLVGTFSGTIWPFGHTTGARL